METSAPPRLPRRCRAHLLEDLHQDEVELVHKRALAAVQRLVGGGADDEVRHVVLDALALLARQRAPLELDDALQDLLLGRQQGAGCAGACVREGVKRVVAGTGMQARLCQAARRCCRGRCSVLAAPMHACRRAAAWPDCPLSGGRAPLRALLTCRRRRAARVRRTCSAKNFVCCVLAFSSTASTRLHASGWSWNALSAASAAVRCGGAVGRGVRARQAAAGGCMRADGGAARARGHGDAAASWRGRPTLGAARACPAPGLLLSCMRVAGQLRRRLIMRHCGHSSWSAARPCTVLAWRKAFACLQKIEARYALHARSHLLLRAGAIEDAHGVLQQLHVHGLREIQQLGRNIGACHRAAAAALAWMLPAVSHSAHRHDTRRQAERSTLLLLWPAAFCLLLGCLLRQLMPTQPDQRTGAGVERAAAGMRARVDCTTGRGPDGTTPTTPHDEWGCRPNRCTLPVAWAPVQLQPQCHTAAASTHPPPRSTQHAAARRRPRRRRAETPSQQRHRLRLSDGPVCHPAR